MIKSKNKDYSAFAFVENTTENREVILSNYDKIAVQNSNGSTFELLYYKPRDVFIARKNTSSFYNPGQFQTFALLKKQTEQKQKDWGKEWAKIANSMSTHGINTDMCALIQKMILVGQEKIQYLSKVMRSYDESDIYPVGMSYEQKDAKQKRLISEFEQQHVAYRETILLR